MTGCLLHNADVEFPGYLSLSQQLKFSDIPNGRLAMLGIFGNMVAEAQTGQTLGEQMGAGNMSLFFVDPKTPPRASTAVNGVPVDESVVGVQAPAGFWDPLGYSTDQ